MADRASTYDGRERSGMIGLLSGTVESVDTDTTLIMLSSGLGFTVRMPATDLSSLHAGQHARIYTVLSASQDQMTLYGFIDESSRRLFTQLQKTSGIGPKVALSLLSTLGATGLSRAIVDGDVSALSTAPGLGRKGAQKIILELSGILSREDAEKTPATMDSDGSPMSTVIQGLMSLGWSEQDSTAAARRVCETDGDPHDGAPSAEDIPRLLRLALASMDRGR